MPEGIYENRIAFDTADGHTHDNSNSKKIDFSLYNLYDFVSKAELEQEVRRIVNAGSINPAGGIYIGDSDFGSIHLGPEVPADGSTGQMSVTTGNNDDGTTWFSVQWRQIDKTDHYLVEMYKSDTGVSGPYRQVNSQTTTELRVLFSPVLSFGLLTSTYYKFVMYPISSAGIKGKPTSVSGVQAATDSDAGARPTWPTSVTNLFVMFRGFITRVNTPVEADIKYGQGQIEWSLTTNKTTDGLWVTNEVQTGQQTAVVINVTGLVTGGVYYLRVRTIDTSGNTSPWSYWNGTTNQGNATAPWDGGTISAIVPNKIEGQNGLGEIGANSIMAGDIYAGTITSDEIQADYVMRVGQKIQSIDFDATNKVGWRILSSGSGDGEAAFYVGSTFHGVTIDNSQFKVQNGSNATVFEVLPTSGNTTIKGNLVVGTYDGRNFGGIYSPGILLKSFDLTL